MHLERYARESPIKFYVSFYAYESRMKINKTWSFDLKNFPLLSQVNQAVLQSKSLSLHRHVSCQKCIRPVMKNERLYFAIDNTEIHTKFLHDDVSYKSKQELFLPIKKLSQLLSFKCAIC